MLSKTSITTQPGVPRSRLSFRPGDAAASRDNSTPFIWGVRYRLRYIRENFTLKNSQVRFAVQLAVIIGLSFLASEAMLSLLSTQFGVWIPLASFLMLYTYRDETMRMMWRQLLGMLVGMVVFVGVVHFIPEQIRLFVVLVFGYGVILMNFSPMVSMAAGTQLALTALYSSMSLGDTLLVRLLFVLTGTFVAVSVIFVLLRSRRSLTISNKMEEMSRVDERLLQQVRVDMEREERSTTALSSCSITFI